MELDPILLAISGQTLTVTLNRPERHNALSDAMLEQLHAALDRAEQLASCRIVVIRGTSGVFCTGMDLNEAAADQQSSTQSFRGAPFFDLLRRITVTPRVVVSLVEGRAVAGGVGLAAASDFVFASEQAQFGLPEALWGLLPCSIAPFLLRRAGFQSLSAMTLSTLPVDANKAERIGLVDEVADDVSVPLRRLAGRVLKLDPATIAAAKRYFAQLWPISKDVETLALGEFDRLLASTTAQQAIAEFASPRKSYPWQR